MPRDHLVIRANRRARAGQLGPYAAGVRGRFAIVGKRRQPGREPFDLRTYGRTLRWYGSEGATYVDNRLYGRIAMIAGVRRSATESATIRANSAAVAHSTRSNARGRLCKMNLVRNQDRICSIGVNGAAQVASASPGSVVSVAGSEFTRIAR